MNLNQVIIAGRLGKDPELKSLPSGGSVCSFSVASNRYWKDKNSGEKKEATDWHNVVFFGKTAEVIAQYFSKGKEILVQGRIQTRSWDGEDGKKNYRTEIIGDSFQFVGSDGGEKKPRASSEGVDDEPVPSIDQSPDETIRPEDIPF